MTTTADARVEMTDLEMTKLCAREMCYTVLSESGDAVWCSEDGTGRGQFIYFPLLSNEQAMALVKRMRLTVESHGVAPTEYWAVLTGNHNGDDRGHIAHDANLNRAIVECVAKMREAS